MSSGDLASTSDQDDVWREDKIEIMGRLMEDHPDINPLVSNYREFHPDGREKTGPNRNDGKLMYVRTRSNLLLGVARSVSDEACLTWLVPTGSTGIRMMPCSGERLQ